MWRLRESWLRTIASFCYAIAGAFFGILIQQMADPELSLWIPGLLALVMLVGALWASFAAATFARAGGK